MLKRIYIENFALVEKLEIEFGAGMNVLTGETGAGKSIIVGAIAQLLGERAEKEDVRSGAKTAIIEGVFDIRGFDKKSGAQDEAELVSGETISIRKEIQAKGNTRLFLDSQLVTLVQLRGITVHIADLFGQHSHQQLLDEQNHLQYLDRFAGITPRVGNLRLLYEKWQSDRRELEELRSRQERDRTERELLQYQRDEIDKAAIRVGEEEELLTERKILDASVMLGEKSEKILEMIDREETSSIHLLNSCRRELGQMIAADEKLRAAQELLETALVNLEEFRSEIERYHASIPDNPERLEEINRRLDTLFGLKKKYGGSEEAILAARNAIEERLNSTLDVEARLKYLSEEITRHSRKYEKESVEISSIRKKAADMLAGAVQKELSLLGFEQARFEIEFRYDDDPEGVLLENRRVRPHPQGLENGRFLIAANPGEPLKSLVKTASGGELSRIMLALLAANLPQKSGNRRLLVFDEVDAGIGGETARAVGRKLASLAEYYQLIVVTHLHQIASFAQNHYAVEKVEASSARRRTVSIKKLDKGEREKEIKRMLSLPEAIEEKKTSRAQIKRR